MHAVYAPLIFAEMLGPANGDWPIGMPIKLQFKVLLVSTYFLIQTLIFLTAKHSSNADDKRLLSWSLWPFSPSALCSSKSGAEEHLIGSKQISSHKLSLEL